MAKSEERALLRLAQKVAEDLQFGHWREDSLTREIATASSLDAAVFRVVKIASDAARALELVLERRLLTGKRGRSKVAAKIGL